MAELNKTAKSSMVKETKKVKVEESAEEAIRQIRIDRQAKLSILREDRIDKLLAAYDEILARVGTRADAEYWCKRLIEKYEPDGAGDLNATVEN